MSKSMNDFFARKKKKAGVKVSNLNDDGPSSVAAPAPKKGSRKDENWKEEDGEPAGEVSSPKQRAVQNLADLADEDEKNQRSTKTWSAAPKLGGAGGAGGMRYAPPNNQPGTVTDRKFPTLGTGLISTAVEVKKSDKAKVDASTNVFANLDRGDDSDEEDDRLMRPALVSKEKGAKVLETKKQEPEEEESESKRKEREEKERRKKDRDEEKKAEREKKEAEMKLLEQQKKAENQEKASQQIKCDTSKFLYGLFDADACAEKYTKREKMPLLELVMA